MLLPNVDAGAKPCEVGDELAPPPNGDDDAAPKLRPRRPEPGAARRAEGRRGAEWLAEGALWWIILAERRLGWVPTTRERVVAAASSKHCSGAVIQAVARPDFVGVAYSNNL